jgi:hypothetical protein
MAKESYELTDARINDIMRRTIAASESARIVPPASTVPTQRIEVVPAPGPIEVVPAPGSIEVVPAPGPVASEKKMVKRISTIYQQMQTSSSIYKKYGGDDSDDDHHQNDAVVVGGGAIDAGACITKLSKSISESINAPITPVTIEKLKSKTNYKFFPTPKMPGTGIMHNNQLLWCVYIAMNGRSAFDAMPNSFVAETEFKYATVDIMRIQKMRIKTQFKRYKLSMPKFEAELISSKKLDISGMMALALCHNQNILYIDNRMYFEIIATTADSDPITVIEKVKNRYCVCDNAVASGTLQMCRDTFWKMESITAPLKSVSHYKLADLQDIYARLGCSGLEACVKKRVTKPDLYAAIMNNIA